MLSFSQEDRRRVSRESASAFARDHSMLGYIETSAIATTNIIEAFLEIVKSGRLLRQQRSQEG